MKKILRLLRGFRSSIHDPKLVLEQNIREMNDKIPELNDRIKQAKDQLKELGEQLSQLNKNISKTRKSLKNARKQKHAGRIANFSEKLEGHKRSVSHLKEKIAKETGRYNNILEEKKTFMKERQAKINEAKDALRALERSKWQAKVADEYEKMLNTNYKITPKQEKLEAKLRAYISQVDDLFERSLNGESINRNQFPSHDHLQHTKELLEMNIREMNDQIPKLNENIATVKASVSLLKKELNRYTSEYQDLESKMKKATSEGRHDIAKDYDLRIKDVKANMVKVKSQLAAGNVFYEKVLAHKLDFMKSRQTEINKAKDLLREVEWTSQIQKVIFQANESGDSMEEGVIDSMEASLSLLKKEYNRYEAEYADLIQKTHQAEKSGRMDILQNYTIRIEEVQFSQKQIQIQLEKVNLLLARTKAKLEKTTDNL